MKEAEVVWILAHLEPATIEEIRAAYPDPPPKSSVRGALRRSMDNGHVERRPRKNDKKGPNPKEYRLTRPPEEQ